MQWFEEEQETEAWHFSSDSSKKTTEIENSPAKMMHIIPPASMEAVLVETLKQMNIQDYKIFDARDKSHFMHEQLKGESQLMFLVAVPTEMYMQFKQTLAGYSDLEQPLKVFSSDVEVIKPIQLG